MEIFNSKSKYLTLFLNGKIEHIINPWYFELDLLNENITVKKRNWYYIGYRTTVISFRFIRKIEIKEHVFGGNILIKALSTNTYAKYLSKKDLEKIKTMIIEYNSGKKRNIIIS